MQTYTLTAKTNNTAKKSIPHSPDCAVMIFISVSAAEYPADFGRDKYNISAKYNLYKSKNHF